MPISGDQSRYVLLLVRSHLVMISPAVASVCLTPITIVHAAPDRRRWPPGGILKTSALLCCDESIEMQAGLSWPVSVMSGFRARETASDC